MCSYHRDVSRVQKEGGRAEGRLREGIREAKSPNSQETEREQDQPKTQNHLNTGDTLAPKSPQCWEESQTYRDSTEHKEPHALSVHVMKNRTMQ